MADKPTGSAPRPSHWFFEKEVSVLLYKINRRPRAQGNLLTQQPEEFREHLEEVLPFGPPVITSAKGAERSWRLGSKLVDQDRSLLSGEIGWSQPHPEARDEYDDEELRWKDAVDEKSVTARSVFVIDLETRELAVLKHSSFSPQTLATVFSDLLELGEGNRSQETTDWLVEPRLDEPEFKEWLASTDVVEKLTFVARRPNPDSMEEFDDLFARMDAIEAGEIREEIKPRNPETGLKRILQDPISKQFVAAAAFAFGYITAAGRRNDRTTRYDQRQRVLHERTPPLPDSWPGVLQEVISIVLRRRPR